MSLSCEPKNREKVAGILIVAGGILLTIIWILGWWKLVELLIRWF